MVRGLVMMIMIYTDIIIIITGPCTILIKKLNSF